MCQDLVPPDWKKLEGGYRAPYDPRNAIAQLREDPSDPRAWTELWDERHHQGDVGEASYAAVPLLVESCREGPRDWNLYALVATIEAERGRADNPDLPNWAENGYERALSEAAKLALEDLESATDPLVIRSAMSLVALARGDRPLGTLLTWLDADSISALVEQYDGRAQGGVQ